MRKLPLFALATVAALTFAGASQAMPVSGAAPIAAADGYDRRSYGQTATTEVRWRRGYHRSWRGHRHWRGDRHWQHDFTAGIAVTGAKPFGAEIIR